MKERMRGVSELLPSQQLPTPFHKTKHPIPDFRLLLLLLVLELLMEDAHQCSFSVLKSASIVVPLILKQL